MRKKPATQQEILTHQIYKKCQKAVEREVSLNRVEHSLVTMIRMTESEPQFTSYINLLQQMAVTTEINRQQVPQTSLQQPKIVITIPPSLQEILLP